MNPHTLFLSFWDKCIDTDYIDPMTVIHINPVDEEGLVENIFVT